MQLSFSLVDRSDQNSGNSIFCKGMQCSLKIALMLAFVTLTVGTLVEIHLGT